MKIRNIIHKGLRRLIVDDDASKLPSEVVPKIKYMVMFLENMKDEAELVSMPHWKPHKLTGNRKGTWSLFVTKNWRLTFAIDKEEIEIIDLNYEDYH